MLIAIRTAIATTILLCVSVEGTVVADQANVVFSVLQAAPSGIHYSFIQHLPDIALVSSASVPIPVTEGEKR